METIHNVRGTLPSRVLVVGDLLCLYKKKRTTQSCGVLLIENIVTGKKLEKVCREEVNFTIGVGGFIVYNIGFNVYMTSDAITCVKLFTAHTDEIGKRVISGLMIGDKICVYGPIGLNLFTQKGHKVLSISDTEIDWVTALSNNSIGIIDAQLVHIYTVKGDKIETVYTSLCGQYDVMVELFGGRLACIQGKIVSIWPRKDQQFIFLNTIKQQLMGAMIQLFDGRLAVCTEDRVFFMELDGTISKTISVYPTDTTEDPEMVYRKLLQLDDGRVIHVYDTILYILTLTGVIEYQRDMGQAIEGCVHAGKNRIAYWCSDNAVKVLEISAKKNSYHSTDRLSDMTVKWD